MMDIAQAIDQKRFKDDYQRLIINLIYTSSWLVNRQNAALKPYDLTVQQFNLMRILRGRAPQPATVQYITERMLDKNSNASRLLDKLCAKGLAERHICPSNRRAVDVHLTEAGQEMLNHLDETLLGANALDRNLTDAQARHVSDMLDQLRGQE